MTIGVVLIVVGAAVYLGAPAIALVRPDPKTTPGGHVAPAWVTTVSLLGGLAALVGIAVVVLSIFGVI